MKLHIIRTKCVNVTSRQCALSCSICFAVASLLYVVLTTLAIAASRSSLALRTACIASVTLASLAFTAVVAAATIQQNHQQWRHNICELQCMMENVLRHTLIHCVDSYSTQA
jgi:hypothetical protein